MTASPSPRSAAWAELHARGLTASAAAAELGRSVNAARNWSRRSGVVWPGTAAKGGPGSPCTIRGVSYPSQAAAARAIGVCQPSIGKALDRWGTADHVGVDRSRGRTGPRNCVRKPLLVGGMAFASQAELARYLRCSQSRLSRALRDPAARAAVAERVLARRMAEDARRAAA